MWADFLCYIAADMPLTGRRLTLVGSYALSALSLLSMAALSAAGVELAGPGTALRTALTIAAKCGAAAAFQISCYQTWALTRGCSCPLP